MRSIKTQLRLASAFVITSGLYFLLGAWSTTDWAVSFLAGLWFSPFGESIQLSREATVLSAVLGGVMTGWGVSLWGMTSFLDVAPAATRRLFISSVGVWFVLDGLGSFIAGSPTNVLLNCIYVPIFAVPLWRLGAILRADERSTSST